MRAEVAPHPVQGELDPRVDIQRVQVVQHQQALHQRIRQQLVEYLSARVARFAQRRHNVAEPVAIQAEQKADQFLRGRGRTLVPARSQHGEQFLDPYPDLPNLGHAPRLSISRSGHPARGCPACVGPVGEIGERGKQVAA